MLTLIWVSAIASLVSAIPTSYDTACKALPAGHGPKPRHDTVGDFYALSALKALSSSAHTPVGYSRVFRAEKGSVSASRYLGSHILTSYSAGNCASLCNAMKGCEGFNIFIERDPSLEPKASKCPNPPSTTNYKCTLWGAPVCASQVKDKGHWVQGFHIVITGSNGYTKKAPKPEPISSAKSSIKSSSKVVSSTICSSSLTKKVSSTTAKSSSSAPCKSSSASKPVSGSSMRSTARTSTSRSSQSTASTRAYMSSSRSSPSVVLSSTTSGFISSSSTSALQSSTASESKVFTTVPSSTISIPEASQTTSTIASSLSSSLIESGSISSTSSADSQTSSASSSGSSTEPESASPTSTVESETSSTPESSTTSEVASTTESLTSDSSPTAASPTTPTTAPACTATSPILNGGFEDYLDHWHISGYGSFSTNSGANSALPQHSGLNEAVYSAGSPGDWIWVDQTISVCPDMLYDFSAWARPKYRTSNTGVPCQLVFFGDGVEFARTALGRPASAAANVWVETTATGVQFSSSTVDFSMRLSCVGITPGDLLGLWLDDVALKGVVASAATSSAAASSTVATLSSSVPAP